MTIICWDGKTLAADRRSLSCGYASTVVKIRRAPNGELLGFSGSYDAGMALAEWFCAGENKDQFPDNAEGTDDCKANLMVIRLDGSVVRYEREPVALPFLDKRQAMGSGRDYALAAMYLGCDARKAVEVACALDVGCGNGIDALEL